MCVRINLLTRAQDADAAKKLPPEGYVLSISHSKTHYYSTEHRSRANIHSAATARHRIKGCRAPAGFATVLVAQARPHASSAQQARECAAVGVNAEVHERERVHRSRALGAGCSAYHNEAIHGIRQMLPRALGQRVLDIDRDPKDVDGFKWRNLGRWGWSQHACTDTVVL